jgi:hypothetical protein
LLRAAESYLEKLEKQLSSKITQSELPEGVWPFYDTNTNCDTEYTKPITKSATKYSNRGKTGAYVLRSDRNLDLNMLDCGITMFSSSSIYDSSTSSTDDPWNWDNDDSWNWDNDDPWNWDNDDPWDDDDGFSFNDWMQYVFSDKGVSKHKFNKKREGDARR